MIIFVVDKLVIGSTLKSIFPATPATTVVPPEVIVLILEIKPELPSLSFPIITLLQPRPQNR